MGDGLSGDRLDRLYSPPEIGAPGKRRVQAQRRDLLLAGTFVLAMAGVVLATLAFLMPSLLGRAYRLDAYFADAKGLDVGMQVLQAGYVIGLVERVQPIFSADGPLEDPCEIWGEASTVDATRRPCFRATLRIQRDWPIPEDSLAQIGAEGLLKGDAIKILPGSSPQPLAHGQTLRVLGQEPDIVARLGALSDSVRILVDESIAPAVESIHAQIRAIETLVGTGEEQGENRKRLAGAFESLQDLSARLRDAVDPKAIADILASVKTMSDNLAVMTSELRGSTGDIQDAVTNYGDLAVDVRRLVKDNRPALQESLDDAQYLLQELSAALTPILTNIEDATRNLSALSRELRKDPKSLLMEREVEEPTPWFR
ncbi:MlaD family protein [Thiorhodococcus minor]|uniref:MCE family protein n=1 Tax=Thiorhodococcus minor TaxID=57489 RepID=A0A6M0JZA7_9GAMM|nr:MlaD family protein [Thiorhodococcus minor]NEV62810.1 MCE family protein [Thiorhodococcus minor]